MMRVLGRVGWAVLGAVALYALTPYRPDPHTDRIVVPARAIEVREVPGEVRWRDRIVYRYVPADLTSLAPDGARLTVESFCAPTIAFARGDTTPQPRTELIRSVTHRSAWLPLMRGELLVTSASSAGDLLARDFRVRDDFGVGTGDSVLVRYPRLGLAKEVTRGAAWGVVFISLYELGKAIIGHD